MHRVGSLELSPSRTSIRIYLLVLGLLFTQSVSAEPESNTAPTQSTPPAAGEQTPNSTPAATSSEATQEFKFAWPVPSRVTVTETTLKKGKTAKMRYDIVLAKSGENLELRFENFQFLNLNGIDLTNAENRKQMGPVLTQITAMGGAIPSLSINSHGDVEDVIGVEKTMEQVIKMYPQSDPKQAASLSAAMRSPAVLASVKEKSKDFWRVWVETWLDFNLSPGQIRTVDTEIAAAGGTIKLPLKLHHEGLSAEAVNCVKLSARSVLEGENAKKALGDLMQALVAQIPTKPGVKPFSPSMIKSVKRTQDYIVVTNPQTLQPNSAKWETVTSLTVDDKSATQIEKHDYAFDWTSSNKKTGAAK